MDWRSYYRSELESPGTRERAEAWLHSALGARSSWTLERNSIVSFPHTAVDYAGPLDATLVTALYRAGVHSVVALGVVHSLSLTPMQRAQSERECPTVRQRAFDVSRGGFVLPDAALGTPFGEVPLRTAEGPVLRQLRTVPDDARTKEFSLDTFLAFLRLGADVLGVRPIPVLPIYVGMTRSPTDGSFEEADRLARLLARDLHDPLTAIVATGDLVHYGTGYGDVAPFIKNPLGHFRDAVERTLAAALGRQERETAYIECRDELKNDQREILPVIAKLLGGSGVARFVHFAMSDYAQILDAPCPCLVASALATYCTVD